MADVKPAEQPEAAPESEPPQQEAPKPKAKRKATTVIVAEEPAEPPEAEPTALEPLPPSEPPPPRALAAHPQNQETGGTEKGRSRSSRPPSTSRSRGLPADARRPLPHARGLPAAGAAVQPRGQAADVPWLAEHLNIAYHVNEVHGTRAGA